MEIIMMIDGDHYDGVHDNNYSDDVIDFYEWYRWNGMMIVTDMMMRRCNDDGGESSVYDNDRAQ